MKRRKPIGTKKRPAVKSEERDEGTDRQTYKVRCSLERAFYLSVEAHDGREAEFIAEQFCEDHERVREKDCHWDSETSHKHLTFEAEES